MNVNTDILANNLQAYTANIGRSTSCLWVDSHKTLKIRNWVAGYIYSLWPDKRHERAVDALIRKNISTLNRLEKSHFIDPLTQEVTHLFCVVHHYNQVAQTILKLPQVRNGHVPELASVVAKMQKKVFVNSEFRKDQPKVVPKKLFTFRNPFFKRHHTLCYPGDTADHGREAASIFLSTQKERLKAFLGFGKKYTYKNKDETEASYSTHMSPIKAQDGSLEPHSYWLGHASLFLQVPIHSTDKTTTSSFNVITDPVEGDLNAIVYPRQTKVARGIEDLPATHVFLLSHNHLDHYCPKTIGKLLSQQPVMIVPLGDGEQLRKKGFCNVVEIKWWEQQSIEFQRGEKTYKMDICATPSHHWAGQGPLGGHESTFVGYVIKDIAGGGDLYFAGDTARLNDSHIKRIRDTFDIRWSFQPGGPDECREDMESTHQSSADGLLMHCELMLKKIYKEGMQKAEFLRKAKELKTIYMHTMTFKLGNLHLSDTRLSVKKIKRALKESIPASKLQPYEEEVYTYLKEVVQGMRFENKKTLSSKELAHLLQKTVAIPKIGSRIDLRSAFQAEHLFKTNKS